MSLRRDLIKLANEKPELRKHLLPLLRRADIVLPITEKTELACLKFSPPDDTFRPYQVETVLGDFWLDHQKQHELDEIVMRNERILVRYHPHDQFARWI